MYLAILRVITSIWQREGEVEVEGLEARAALSGMRL